MKKMITTLLLSGAVMGCSGLSSYEQERYSMLNRKGISVDKPVDTWTPPADPGAAGVLNVLPGIGNFYLAAGDEGESAHYVFGALNLLTWPVSILWGIPEAAIDANNINKRSLIHHIDGERP
ncbi:MAG: hypothetical protein LBU87_01470 [Lactobacillales bacterium]|jgi:hypothetical protein|nr:hypothetical protein [Lactobacillales bacterium]